MMMSSASARKRKITEVLPAITEVLLGSDESSSSSDSDDSYERQKPRKLPKSQGYYNLIERMDEDEFRSHFRLGFESFKEVVEMIESDRATEFTHGYNSKQKALIALWYLASDSSFRTVSQQFGCAESTAQDSLEKLVQSVLRRKNDIIKMPTTEAEFKQVADRFYTYGFPNVVGAIDGTSIILKVPDEQRIDFMTRKHVTAMNLTAVCDANKTYQYIVCGHSARSNDAHIFSSCSLARDIFHNSTIPQQFHIIGDAAYGNHVNVMAPFKGDNLPANKELYNTLHSSTRMVVERSFSDLKNRWLRLKCLRNDPLFACDIIATCCCLHNIAIKNNDIASTQHPVNNGYHVLDFGDATSKKEALVRHLN